MVLSKRLELPDLVVVTLTGVVTSRDQADIVCFSRAAIQTCGSIRVLLRLEQFAGWNPDTGFDHTSLWLRDDEGVRAIAVLGPDAARIGVLTLMTQPLRQVPLEYFTDEAEARGWLTMPPRIPVHASTERGHHGRAPAHSEIKS